MITVSVPSCDENVGSALLFGWMTSFRDDELIRSVAIFSHKTNVFGESENLSVHKKLSSQCMSHFGLHTTQISNFR